ncbi:DUF2061 domain-containing protein [Sneathiella limimaris]|uniref:DUF2061 domain-containing protein n=1 Tax=Sneathiella limimaris TaxID=1964213 RepID=UPI00146AB00D|nr:DUF2061 domain-containing protein [Sneathiella limimaris]
MESTFRIVIKSVTWQLLGIIVVTMLSYIQTGEVLSAFMLAVSASFSGFVFFFIHEKIWSRITWGRQRKSA